MQNKFPAIVLLALLWPAVLSAAPRDLTFFLVSDTHYGTSTNGDKTIPLLVDKMNQLPGTEYPPALGGKVAKPRGVIHLGDISNAGKKEQWDMFVRDYGLKGGDGRLAWPVYETFGNHDGGIKLPVRMGVRERNQQRVGLTAISTNGMHYSWEWDGIHFVNCGISVGTVTNPYDPQFSIEFLKSDLKKEVGNSGRPVIVMHHFGFDKAYSLNWWSETWRTNYFEVIKDYNVIGILHGHGHKPVIYQWRGFDVYHPPHFRGDPKKNEPVTHGFFVFHITDNELAVAERKLDDTWGMTSRKTFRTSTAVAE